MVLTAKSATVKIGVPDESYVGVARRTVRTRAAEVGLSGAALDKLDILSTELATNLYKYATGGGEILVLDTSAGTAKAVTLISVDRGPGIPDVDKALIDGMSTSQTLGAGLGSLKRRSDAFEINSIVGKGTILITTVFESGSKPEPSKALDIAWISLPHPAEQACGDGVSVFRNDSCTSILVVDALGHGALAADASTHACSAFDHSPLDDPLKSLERIHAELAGSRGAAVALCQIEPQTHKLKYVGVGNISSRIYSYYSSTGCVSSQGIVGDKIGTPKLYTHDWEPGSTLLVYSDGIKSAAALESGKHNKSAMMLAAQMYRDFYRGNDDATILVAVDRRAK